MEYKLRSYNSNELPPNTRDQIFKIYCDVDLELKYHHVPSEFDAILEKGDFVLVSIVDDKVVGFVTPFLIPDYEKDRDAIYIFQLYISSKHRGKRIGKMLYEGLEEFLLSLRETNHNYPGEIALSCTIDNIEFWLKMGFAPKCIPQDMHNISLEKRVGVREDWILIREACDLIVVKPRDYTSDILGKRFSVVFRSREKDLMFILGS